MTVENHPSLPAGDSQSPRRYDSAIVPEQERRPGILQRCGGAGRDLPRI